MLDLQDLQALWTELIQQLLSSSLCISLLYTGSRPRSELITRKTATHSGK